MQDLIEIDENWTRKIRAELNYTRFENAFLIRTKEMRLKEIEENEKLGKSSYFERL